MADDAAETSEIGQNAANNVSIAFAVVIGAGLATAVGASVVFFPWLVKFANRKTLAASLGLSAGVMLYVSFVEIFVKSASSFLAAGHGEGGSAVYTTVCFFSGIFFMLLLNSLIHALAGDHHHGGGGGGRNNNNTQSTTKSQSSSCSSGHHDAAQPQMICCSPDPGRALDNIQTMGEQVAHFEQAHPDEEWEGREFDEPAHNNNNMVEVDIESTTISDNNNDEELDMEAAAEADRAQKRKLVMTGLNTALAIALHNFPEGLATFVATLEDPAVGAVLGISIAIHNIPEGLCVAMPIYYATGSRWRAFGYAVFSGLSEPIAALLGWAVLAKSFSDTLYAVLFGLVAGMMVIISVKELLPTAQRYDPDDSVVTTSFVVGMGIMALSLVLFAA